MNFVVKLLIAVQFFTSIFVAYEFIQMRQVDEQNAQSRIALCALQDDYTLRMERATGFLEENPQGSGGISRSLVLRSIADYRRTLDALNKVDCD